MDHYIHPIFSTKIITIILQVIRERSEEFNKLYGNKKTMEELLGDDEEEGVAGKKQKRAFLDMLLCTAADGQKMTFDDIREEVDTFMFEV